MRNIKLTPEEKKIEDALVSGEYKKVSKKEFDEIAQAIERRKKDTVLNIRVNSYDLKSIKQKAKKYGVKYQTFISEFIHRLAQS